MTIPGLRFARGVDATLNGVGPSNPVSWVDLNGDPASLVLDDGVEYLVLAHAEIVNEADNTQWGAGHFRYDSTVYAEGRSTFRFTTFGGNDASGGQVPAVFVVTGDGESELEYIMTAESSGSVTDSASIEALCVPTSELGDFHFQESSNGSSIEILPTSGWTELGEYELTPDATARYLVAVYCEVLGDGTETTSPEGSADEYALRVEIDSSVFQQAVEFDTALGFAAGEPQHSIRWVIPVDCTENVPVTVRLEMNGTLGAGNLGARRIRFASFRLPGIWTVQTGNGINGNPGAGNSLAFAESVNVPATSSLCTCLGTFETQASNFVYGQFEIDSSELVPPQGFFRGTSNTGATSTDDILPVAFQHSLEFAAGTHTVGMRSTWVTAGVTTWGRNRGNTSDVPQTLVVVEWAELDEEEPGENEFQASSINESFASVELQGTGSFASESESESSASVQFETPELPAITSYFREDFDYTGSPLDHGWSFLNLIEGNTPTIFEAVDGEFRFAPSVGGPDGSSWYQRNDGQLLYRRLSGDAWRIEAKIRVLNAAGTGLPPATQFRIGGIAVHDYSNWPSSPSSDDSDRQADYNFIHGGFGAFNRASIQAEWKNNVNGTTNTEAEDFPSGDGFVAIERNGQEFAIEVSGDGESWTPLQSIDRSSNPMPETLNMGVMAYSQPVATPDLQVRIDWIEVTFPGELFQAESESASASTATLLGTAQLSTESLSESVSEISFSAVAYISANSNTLTAALTELHGFGRIGSASVSSTLAEISLESLDLHTFHATSSSITIAQSAIRGTGQISIDSISATLSIVRFQTSLTLFNPVYHTDFLYVYTHEDSL